MEHLLARKIESDIKDAEILACINRLANYFLSVEPEKFQYITHQYLSEVSGINSGSSILEKSITYITSETIPILKINYEYIDEHEVGHSLSPSEVKQTIQSKSFFHPDTEEEVYDFESKIFIYYSVNTKFISKVKGDE